MDEDLYALRREDNRKSNYIDPLELVLVILAAVGLFAWIRSGNTQNKAEAPNTDSPIEVTPATK